MSHPNDHRSVTVTLPLPSMDRRVYGYQPLFEVAGSHVYMGAGQSDYSPEFRYWIAASDENTELSSEDLRVQAAAFLAAADHLDALNGKLYGENARNELFRLIEAEASEEDFYHRGMDLFREGDTVRSMSVAAPVMTIVEIDYSGEGSMLLRREDGEAEVFSILDAGKRLFLASPRNS